MRASVLASLLLALSACTEPPEIEPDFTVRPGVEIATVLDATPRSPLTLYSPEGERLLTVLADDLGQAHFAYVPDEHMVIDSNEGMRLPILNGGVLRPGDDYEIRNDETGETSGLFTVRGVDTLPIQALYDIQELHGIVSSPISGDEGDPSDGFQYIQMRDGTLLSAMVRFPDPLLYGEGPYPTVIEYSGYSPSRPDRPDSGTRIANALGYATVAVNMRGTGCSGGVFDVFNRAQHADGYDVVEVVAGQDWVLNGQVGMVGLSYPGITQLFVASTNPPHLAGIVPLSTIADSWEMQWPGGIYNQGFTRTWVEERENAAAAGGTSWVTDRIEGGDATCEDNTRLSSQSIDFESFLHGLEFRPRDADDRDLVKLVEQVETAVYLGGAFQDEQTGASFGHMLDRFYSSRATKFLIYNGRHPDGYGPNAVFRWYEFLEFYVAERIPKVQPALRLLGAEEFGATFGVQGFTFEDDRFTDYASYDEALAAYEAEAPVRVLFESGAGGTRVGTPEHRYEAQFQRWPSPTAVPRTWSLAPGGALTDEAPSTTGADAWAFDPEAGTDTFFGPAGYELLVPLWDIDWRRFDADKQAAYLTAPFQADTVIAAPGYADLWLRSPVDDLAVQVTLTEVRADGNETLIQSGWLRIGHRKATVGDDLRLERSFDQFDFEPVPVDTWVQAKVALPSVAHAIRAGSRLRMIVSTPGRDHGTWEFEAPAYDAPPTFELGYGPGHASSLVLATLPGIDVPDEPPPCPGLRGQPCRAYLPTENVPAR